MTQRLLDTRPTSATQDHALHLDERSMRLLELTLAALALAAAILLGVR